MNKKTIIVIIALLTGFSIYYYLYIMPTRTLGYTIPTGVSRIENLSEVKAALRSEKEDLSAFTDEIKQIQLDMNELYTSFERLESMDETSQERMLILQMLMDKKEQTVKTMSNILEVFQNTQRDIISNLK